MGGAGRSIAPFPPPSFYRLMTKSQKHCHHEYLPLSGNFPSAVLN